MASWTGALDGNRESWATPMSPFQSSDAAPARDQSSRARRRLPALAMGESGHAGLRG
jgi:hypothetical protein